MDESNGQTPVSGWVIVQVGSLTLVGRYNGEAMLEAYELRPQLGRTETGLARNFTCFPLLLLAQVRPFPVQPSMLIPLESLTTEDQKAIMAAAGNARELREAIKAAQSPISIAKVLPKLKGRGEQ